MKAAFDGSVVKRPHSGVQLAVLAEMTSMLEYLGDVSQSVFFCRDQEFRDRLHAVGGGVGSLPRVTSNTLFRVLWQQFYLPRLLARSGADVLHALAYTAPLRCPVPYVLNVHDIIALDRPELCAPLNRLHMRCLLPRSIHGADALIVSTHYVADRVCTRLGVPGDRITVCPLGVDAERFGTPAARPPMIACTEERPYLLFIGNLEPKKDVGTLLDAYEGCASSLQVDLVIVGRAAWLCAELVERIRNWRSPGRIHWLGRLSARHIPGLMQHANALVMPSVEEGFGMPVLEAMAASTAVIHSDHPALEEAAGSAGLRFPRGDAAELAVRIDRVMSDDTLREELEAAGRARAADMTWANWGRTAADVLQQVAAGA